MSADVVVMFRVYYPRTGNWMGRIDAIGVPGDVYIACDATISRRSVGSARPPLPDVELTVHVRGVRDVTIMAHGWERKLAGGGRWGSALVGRADVVRLCRHVLPSGSVEWWRAEGRVAQALREEGVLR